MFLHDMISYMKKCKHSTVKTDNQFYCDSTKSQNTKLTYRTDSIFIP